jgi:hypothetical protein
MISIEIAIKQNYGLCSGGKCGLVSKTAGQIGTDVSRSRGKMQETDEGSQLKRYNGTGVDQRALCPSSRDLG